MKKRSTYRKKLHEFNHWLAYQNFTKVVITVTGTLTVILMAIIFIRYKSTQTWAIGALNGRQSEVPPEFARNIYSVDAASDMKKLANVNSTLDQIAKDGGVTDQTIDKDTDIYKESKKILAKYHVTGGSSYHNQEHLKLYLDTYHFIQTAYAKPNANKVNSLSSKLTELDLSNNTHTNTKLIKQLKGIANDYNKLSAFSDHALNILGNDKHNIITVRGSLTQSQVDELLDDSNTATLQKFANIRHLRTVLGSQSLHDVLSVNKSYTKKQKWEAALDVYHSLTQGQYIAVSDIKTLKDVNKYNLAINPVAVPGNMKLLGSSKVVKLTYQGQTLDKNQYIKIGAKVTATIDPKFSEVKTKAPNNNTNGTHQTNQNNNDHTKSDNKSNSKQENNSNNKVPSNSNQSHGRPATGNSNNANNGNSDSDTDNDTDSNTDQN